MIDKIQVSAIRKNLKLLYPNFKFKVSKNKNYVIVIIISGPLNLKDILMGKLTLTKYFINTIEDQNIKSVLTNIYDTVTDIKNQGFSFTESIRIGEYNKKYEQIIK